MADEKDRKRVQALREVLKDAVGVVSVEEAKVLLAYADVETGRAEALQEGLDAAHARLAELEGKLANELGHETAMRLRERQRAARE